MLIEKNRIKNCSKYMSHIAEGETAYIGLQIKEDISARMKEIGFNDVKIGESLVPSPNLGPVSRFNANGKYELQKDKPKETVYHEVHWELKDWGGNYHSGTSYRPYPRYPRKWTPAPWLELLIVQSGEKQFILAGSSFVKGDTDEEKIKHQINLMLEIFKQVEIFQENLESYEIPKVNKLNWDVLPEGKMPWSTFQKYLKPVLEKKSKNKKIVIFDKLETVSQYNPDFHAIGTNGYHGYIIFGFTQLNLFVFENAEYGNATYVFEGNWKEISQMTKADIINKKLYKHRFIHSERWADQIKGLLSESHDEIVSST